MNKYLKFLFSFLAFFALSFLIVEAQVVEPEPDPGNDSLLTDILSFLLAMIPVVIGFTAGRLRQVLNLLVSSGLLTSLRDFVIGLNNAALTDLETTQLKLIEKQEIAMLSRQSRGVKAPAKPDQPGFQARNVLKVMVALFMLGGLQYLVGSYDLQAQPEFYSLDRSSLQAGPALASGDTVSFSSGEPISFLIPATDLTGYLVNPSVPMGEVQLSIIPGGLVINVMEPKPGRIELQAYSSGGNRQALIEIKEEVVQMFTTQIIIRSTKPIQAGDVTVESVFNP